MGTNASKEDLLKELHAAFAAAQKQLGFTSSWEDINGLFFVSDAILTAGFVSDSFSRQLCTRIVEIYMSWNNYLHGLVMPVPHYMIQMNENKMLSDEDKREALRLITEAMSVVTMNSVVSVNRDKRLEAAFIDQAVSFWKETYRPRLQKLIEKVHGGWNS